MRLEDAVRMYFVQNGPKIESPIRSFLVDETSTLNSFVSMPVKTITTNSLREIGDDKYQELELLFFSSSDESTSPPRRTQGGDDTRNLNFFVIIPRTWTPRRYLAAINLSLEKCPVITVEAVQIINGKSYLTINNVAYYFNFPYERVSKMLVDSASYANIHGGGRYGI